MRAQFRFNKETILDCVCWLKSSLTFFFSFLWTLGFYLRNNSRGHSFMICCIDVSLPRVILPVPQKKKFWPCSNTQLCCVSFVQFTNVNDRQWDPAIYSPSLNDSVNTNSWNDPWNKLDKSILTIERYFLTHCTQRHLLRNWYCRKKQQQQQKRGALNSHVDNNQHTIMNNNNVMRLKIGGRLWGLSVWVHNNNNTRLA